MQQYAGYASQVFEVFRQHLPAEVLDTQIPTGAVAMLIGVSVCVLGAKLARWFSTIVFASVGLVVGMKISQHYTAVSFPVAAMVGGLAIGAIGYSLHRFLVGLFAGLFLSSVAFSLVSSQMALPQLQDFIQVENSHRNVEVRDFQPGPAGGVTETGWQQLGGYGTRFWNYIVEQRPNIRRHAVGWTVGAGLLGMLMGLFLNRLTLILFTAALGTILISGGMFVMANGMGMDLFESTPARQGMSALAIVSLFAVSIALQSALTRKPSTPASE